MNNNRLRPQRNDALEGIDLEKLKMVARKNLWAIIIIFIVTNLGAYLTIRWTKDVYESSSELRLEIKQDATALGIAQIVEDQNRNIIAGEIEQMKSKLFFSRVLDSLDLWVSYYSAGNVLEFEMYRASPFRVNYTLTDKRILDKPIYFDFIEGNKYQIKIGEEGEEREATLGEPLVLEGASFLIQLAPNAQPDFKNHFFFIINSREKLVEFLTDNLKIEPLNFDANTIRISLRDFSVRKVYTIVNKIDSVYLHYSNEQKNSSNKQKIEWLNNELGQVETKMENFENYFENFTLKNKSSNLDSDLRKTIFVINQLDSQRFELNRKITDISTLMDDLSSGKTTAFIMPKPYLPTFINERIEEFQKITQDQNKLTLSYKDNTYAFQQKEKEVNTIKSALFGQLTEVRKNWMGSMVELNQKKAKLEKDFATMPDKNTQFSKNQRFYKLYEEFYLSMMQAKAEFEIAQAGSTPDFKILSSAVLPTKPVAPNRYIILGIGFVGGLILNFFFIGIIYLSNNKITGLTEIERSTGVPVLGVIPEMKNKAASPFYIVDNPRSIVSEAIRTLRTNLDFFTSSDKKKVIVISSSVSGEGKSFLAMNLGGILAMSKKKVILLDLDMRKAKENSHADIKDPSKGVSTILIHRNTLAESITKTSLEGLDFIPAGPHPPNPSELLLNGEFEDLLTELRGIYDYIVIDTPPVGLVTDGIMAMKRADLSIYVVRANYSKKEFLSNLERLISINKLSNVAVVLNALPNTGKTYGYGYYQEDKSKKHWLKQIFN
ncbi:MAG: polysaccharide biosynthesis tyrosine autokinase [Cyclobacteriaceae bacterium]|nr:polysaccharide biosynthesis tyrosine autokinase [Cyclobacteriaceae bacterium]